MTTRAGRPSGEADTNRATFREGIAKNLQALLAKVLERALGGDMAASKLLLDRSVPPLKPVAPLVKLPELAAATTASDQARAIVLAIAESRLPPDVGSQLLDALGNLAAIAERDELTRRIAALESKGFA
jgi:hypothetical protein